MEDEPDYLEVILTIPVLDSYIIVIGPEDHPLRIPVWGRLDIVQVCVELMEEVAPEQFGQIFREGGVCYCPRDIYPVHLVAVVVEELVCVILGPLGEVLVEPVYVDAEGA